MNRLILKRIFMLILFLDKAKLARLIPSDPCLFNKVLIFFSCSLYIARPDMLGENMKLKNLYEHV
jgi:hypothetical protein